MIAFYELAEYCKAEAIAAKLTGGEVSDWRYFCREYSKTFFTPLHVVMTLSPEHVILSVFEDQLGKRNVNVPEDLEAITEEIARLQDPDYDSTKEKAIDLYVAGLEEWERQRVAKGLPIPKPLHKRKKVQEEPALAQEQELPPDLPKQGFVDLSRFNQDEES
jgi:hypothetical protein